MKSPNPSTAGILPACVLPSAIRPDQRGSALIITLMFVVLATILVIGFADQIRIERSSAKSYLERARAEQFARMGLDSAKGILDRYTGNSSEVWASQPGALMVPATAGTKTLSLSAPLHSGNSSLSANATAAESQAAELNIPMLADIGVRLITNDVPSLPLRWIYVREDGTLDTAEPPVLTNTANPLVGRFAFWVDDESSKINLNTAWERGGSNPYLQSHPTSISLSAISANVTTTMVDDLHTAITGSSTGNYSVIDRFLNSPAEAGSVGPGWADAIQESKFQVTHYNHAPGTTFFGEPRIVLTTQQMYAPRDSSGNLLTNANGIPYFLDILTNSGNTTARGADPGLRANIDQSKFNNAVNLLVAYMQRNNWPMVSGPGSIQSKYYADDPGRLAQLAINIIEYVRSAESREPFIEPVRVGYVGGVLKNDFQEPSIIGSDTAFVGIGRGLCITEVGFSRDTTDTATVGGTTYFRCKFTVEVHLPPNGGIDEIDLLAPSPGKSFYIWLVSPGYSWGPTTAKGNFPASGGTSAIYYRKSNPPVEDQKSTPTALSAVDGASPFSRIYPLDIKGGSSVMEAGDYRVLEKDFWVPDTLKANFVAGRSLCLRAVLCVTNDSSTTAPTHGEGAASSPRLRYAPAANPLTATLADASDRLWIQLGPEGNALANADTVQNDDPQLGGIAGDWKQAAGSNTLGSENSASVRTLGTTTTSPNVSAQVPQDTDASGRISDASARMPYPRGHPKNPDGVVQSVGELGFIHTGVEGQSLKSGVPRQGIPWRTLRLQPTDAKPTNVVPDWAFMDLFTVATAVPNAAKKMFTPYGSHVAGRINVNSKAEPFGNPAVMGNGTLTRIAPLKALLTGVTKTSTGNATLTEAEATTLATNIYNRTLSSKGKIYGFADGYDSPGEIAEIAGVADGGEETEEVLRGIASLTSARGSVFTVYTIGQSLKQTPANTLVITGEQRQQVMLEGYPDTASPTTGPSPTKYRPVSVRTLSP